MIRRVVEHNELNGVAFSTLEFVVAATIIPFLLPVVMIGEVGRMVL